MLDMGMIQEVKRIISKLPQDRQTLLFSATMPSEIKKLVKSSLFNPKEIYVAPPMAVIENIKQSVYMVDKEDKPRLLLHLLKKLNISSMIIFARTKFRANDINELLLEAGYSSDVIHSERSQSARQRVIKDLKKGNIQILVATDLAARGLDISELSHVINYDLTSVPETYVHRIGRTGRAGSKGIAISFCDKNEKKYLKAIEEGLGVDIYVEKDHPYHVREAKPSFSDLQRIRLEREQKEKRALGGNPKKKVKRRGKKGPSKKPKSFIKTKKKK
jgi:ATP-dependent RNA helicase RhlE